MSVGGPPSQVNSRIGHLAKAFSSISKPVGQPDMMMRPLGAIPANVHREDTPSRCLKGPLPAFDEGLSPLAFQLPA